jgi:DNA-binding protein YbaB
MGFFDKLKDLNEMRKQAKQIEMVLGQEMVTGASSGEKVKLTIDGNQVVKSVEVDDSIVGDKSEIARHTRQALEDLFNKHKKLLQTKFGGMFGQ